MHYVVQTYPRDVHPSECLDCRWEGATQLADLDREGLVTHSLGAIITSAVVRSWPPISTISSVLAKGALTSAAICKTSNLVNDIDNDKKLLSLMYLL